MMLRIIGFPFAVLLAASAPAETFDIVIYGATPAGLSAAVQATRMGQKTVLLEPTGRIGGMTTGGLGHTDSGNQSAFGGLARKFYEDVATHYADDRVWTRQRRSDYVYSGQSADDGRKNAMWSFEPSAALCVLEQWEKREGLDIRRHERLNRAKGKVKVVEVEGGGRQRRIVSLVTEGGTEYRGKVFIDATYEGDLMAAAGVTYVVGREPNAQYGEHISGIQRALATKHQIVDGVSAYVKEGDRASGLLPGVEEDVPLADGEGDSRVQAYCYRMCLTDDPANRIPFRKPAGYRELDYELLIRNLRKSYALGLTNDWVKGLPWINARMPNRKTDTNNRLGVSTDFIGGSQSYPEASYAERAAIEGAHLRYQQGLMWTLAYHPRVPEYYRREISRWGTCRDEFVGERGDGWPNQIYVREARRMVGEYVMTEHNCRGRRLAPRPVALGAYTMDSHHVRRYVDKNGCVRNEGDVQVNAAFGGERFKPYPIDYGSLVPKRGECANLLVPVCVSASHMAFGSIRMEPVFFALGQVAGTAAAQAVDANCAVQDLPYKPLAARLLRDGQVLRIEGAGFAARAAAPLEIAGELPKLEDAKLETFLTEVYGRRPVERPTDLSFEDMYPPETFSRPKRNVDAHRRIVECRYRGPYGEGSFPFTVFLPKDAKGPVPAYLLINISNSGLHADPWRFVRSELWPVEEITDRGYAAITFRHEDVAPDTYDSRYAHRFGVFRCFEKPGGRRADDAWGTLSAWAWAASRIMDWIETCPDIDSRHVAVVGHSRGGKAALVVGVTDKRFAMTVSNGSGCGGAKLNHAVLPRSEHLANILHGVEYWFCANYRKWIGREEEMPFDQHQWLSLVAPRLLYVASGSTDDWAGPEGEKASVDLARPAWGARGAVDVGYHCHEGPHALRLEDWRKFMDFTDAHGWVKNPPARLPALVPKPHSVTVTGGTFRLTATNGWKETDWYDFDRLGHCLSQVPMLIRTDASVPREGYRLEVAQGGVTIVSSDAAGAFYARQTLRQLAKLTATNAIAIPCCTIADAPQYRWRGMLLDECRHFFGKEIVKRQIGLMARHKMNVLHWHLTDDQGWRIDIAGHPELVKYGSVRPKSVAFGTHARWLPPERKMEQAYNAESYGPYFYSADDVREVLAFAEAHHVTVIPEIELPGHVRAFLAAHPECSCRGAALPRIPRCGNSIEEEVLCVGNDDSLRLFEEILDGVCALFPNAPFVHIGGDECPRVRWKTCPKCQARMKAEGLKDENGLQAWFTARIVRHLEMRGRRAVGWDEVLAGDVPSSTVGMCWRGSARGGAGTPFVSAAESIARGHDMVMAPGAFCYLDKPQGLGDDPYPYYSPWPGSAISLEKSYAFDPAAGLSAEARRHVLGGQANLWTESTFNVFDLDWKTWPRACAIAEALWLGDAKPPFADFRQRMESHRRRLIGESVNCAPLETPRYRIER